MTPSDRPPGFLPALLAITALILLFGTIAALVSLNATASFDRSIVLSLRSSDLTRPIGPDWLAETFRDVTSLGSVVVVLALATVAGGFCILTGRRHACVLLLISAIGSLLLNDLLKFIFDRPRPDAILRAARVFSSGFPSGHAALSCSVFLTLAIIIGRETQSRPARSWLWWSTAFIIIAVGFSRVYLGVHYPTDIVAGWCVGGILVLSLNSLLPNRAR